MADARGRSCCLFGARWFAVPQHFGNPHQVVGQYRRAHQNLETLTAFGPASLHPPAAKQHRDATLDASAKALALLERSAPLQRFPLRSLLPATLGNAHLADASLLAVLLVFGTVKAPIARVQLGTTRKDLFMSVERRLHLIGVG